MTMDTKTSKARLPRRYDTAMKALRGLAQSNSERVRLAAVLRMTDIYLDFDRSQERIAIALARAEARKAEAPPDNHSAGAAVCETAEESAARFLVGLRQRGVLNDAE